MEVQSQTAGSEKHPRGASVQDQGDDGEIREEYQLGEPSFRMELARVERA